MIKQIVHLSNIIVYWLCDGLVRLYWTTCVVMLALSAVICDLLRGDFVFQAMFFIREKFEKSWKEGMRDREKQLELDDKQTENRTRTSSSHHLSESSHPPPTSVSMHDCRGHMRPIKLMLTLMLCTKSMYTCCACTCIHANAHTCTDAHSSQCKHEQVPIQTHTFSKSKIWSWSDKQRLYTCCRPKGVHHGNKRVGQQDAASDTGAWTDNTVHVHTHVWIYTHIQLERQV